MKAYGIYTEGGSNSVKAVVASCMFEFEGLGLGPGGIGDWFRSVNANHSLA
jgi:hypothetical protein